MISVLIPTRGRPESLARTVALLEERASDRCNFEVIVRADDCDLHAASIVESSRYDQRIIAERHGYRGFHHYMNEMASYAQGEWLLLWGDDLQMSTAEWDDRFLAEARAPLVYLQRNTWYPVLHRSAFEVLGHYSRMWCCGAYLSWVFTQSKAQIQHLNFAITNCLHEGRGGRTPGQQQIVQESVHTFGKQLRNLSLAERVAS